MDGDTLLFFSLLSASIFKFSALQWIRNRQKKIKQYVGKITELYIYPVKSCKGVDVGRAECEPLGLKVGHLQDRHWMVVNKSGLFQSQRALPSMALIQPSFHGDMLHLDAPGMKTLKVPAVITPNDGEVITCEVWGQKLPGISYGTQASEWLSSYLKKEGVKLVSTHAQLHKRQLAEKLEPDEPCVNRPETTDEVAYADWASFMLLSEASVADLNTRIQTPVDIRNFRPNIVVDGCTAYDEDTWNHLSIGNTVTFRHIRPGTRCTLTTVDPEKGIKRTDKEPLETLKRYRLQTGFGDSPLFAINLALDRGGVIKVGDPIYATRV